jgi:hypothetical protein
MARLRDIQTAQYKSDKASGLTTAKTFKEWLDAEKAIDAMMQESTDSTSLLSIESIINTIDTAIETIDTTSKIVVEAAKINKRALANEIYDREEERANKEKREIDRKAVLASFMSLATLTKAGADTYYQNIRNKKKLSVS